MSNKQAGAARPALAYVMLTFVALTWASATVILRGVHEQIPPLQLTCWRWSIGALFLLALGWSDIKAHRAIISINVRQYFVVGCFTTVGSSITATALHFTTAINGGLVNAAQPAVTAMLAWLLLREKLSVRQVAGILLAVIGIVAMISRLNWTVITSFQFNAGDVLMLVAVVSYGLYATNVRKLPKQLGLNATLFCLFAAGSLALIPFAIAEAIYFDRVTFSWQIAAAVVYLALIPSVLAMWLWNTAIHQVGVNRSAVFLNLIPVFGAAMAIAFLGESLQAYHLIGALLVGAGIALVVRAQRA